MVGNGALQAKVASDDIQEASCVTKSISWRFDGMCYTVHSVEISRQSVPEEASITYLLEHELRSHNVERSAAYKISIFSDEQTSVLLKIAFERVWGKHLPPLRNLRTDSRCMSGGGCDLDRRELVVGYGKNRAGRRGLCNYSRPHFGSYVCQRLDGSEFWSPRKPTH